MLIFTAHICLEIASFLNCIKQGMVRRIYCLMYVIRGNDLPQSSDFIAQSIKDKLIKWMSVHVRMSSLHDFSYPYMHLTIIYSEWQSTKIERKLHRQQVPMFRYWLQSMDSPLLFVGRAAQPVGTTATT